MQNGSKLVKQGRAIGHHRRITSQPENFGKQQLIENKISPKPQAIKQKIGAV